MADTNMTVRFLKGTQASLDQLLQAKSGYSSGAFYLTTDSDRLYFAQSATELVPLNQFIRTITSAELQTIPASDLNAGDYYYVSDANILMIRNPQNTSWTQINAPSVNYDFNFGNKSLTLTGSDNSQDVFHYDAVTSGTGIGEGVVVNSGTTTTANDTMQVGHKAYTTTVSTIAASQTPNAGATFNIVKGVQTTNGHVTGYEYATIKLPDAIANTTYKLSNNADVADTTPAANISLKGSDGDYTHVELEAGTALTVAADGANKIKYSHANVTRTDSAIANGGELNPEDPITVVDDVKSDDQGHVINVKKKQYTLPKDIHLTSLGLGLTNKSQLIATLSDSSEVITPEKTFYYKITVDGTSNDVINQGDLGSFYSATKVNELIEEAKNSIDALTYKGTLGTGGTVATLPTTGVHIGDVYKVFVAGTYGSQETNVGDLFIAQGTETNGVITSDLTWTYVPSGDDTDTQYTLVRNGNTVGLQANTAAAGTYAGSFTVSGDDKWIQVSNLGISHIGPDTASVAMLTPTKATETIENNTFTALTSVFADSKGHITSLGEKTFTIPKDSKYNIGSAVNETKITLTGLADSGAAGESSNVELIAGTQIALDGSVANKITINHGQITTNAIVGTGTINVNREFSAITDISATNGHVESYTTSTFTLPADADSKYALSGASVASTSLAADIAVATSAAVAITATLTGSASGAGEITTAAFNMQSKSLAIGGSSSVAQIELVWGTF